MQLLEDAAWSLVVPTSMGVRLTPEHRASVHAADRFLLQVTSAESNVASVLAALGEPSLVLTAFVEGSPVSALIKADLRRRHLSYEGPSLPQGGAWGYRHQLALADSGYGGRAPRVWNDRAGEVGLALSADQFDLERLFGTQGVKVLHLSGLIASLSSSTAQFCVDLATTARAHGTVVSLDLNYRASFWRGREAELSAAFAAIAENCDILYGNEEDFQLCLGIEGPEAGGTRIGDALEDFRAMIGRIKAAYPRARWIGTSLREVVSANHHRWGLLLWHDGEFALAPLRDIEVLDRIGGGDGSMGGLLYGVIKGWTVTQCAQFGWAAGALAATSLLDYATPADEKQVWDFWAGNARVQR